MGDRRRGARFAGSGRRGAQHGTAARRPAGWFATDQAPADAEGGRGGSAGPQADAGALLVELSAIERGQLESVLDTVELGASAAQLGLAVGVVLDAPYGQPIEALHASIESAAPGLRRPGDPDGCPTDTRPHTQWVELLRDVGLFLGLLETQHPGTALARVERHEDHADLIVTRRGRSQRIAVSLTGSDLPVAVLPDLDLGV